MTGPLNTLIFLLNLEFILSTESKMSLTINSTTQLARGLSAEETRGELNKHKRWSKVLVEGAMDITRFMELIEIHHGRMQRNTYSFMKQVTLLQSNVNKILEQAAQGKDSDGYLLNILSQANQQLYDALRLGNNNDPNNLGMISIKCGQFFRVYSTLSRSFVSAQFDSVYVRFYDPTTNTITIAL